MKWMEGRMRKTLGIPAVNMRQDGNCEATEDETGDRHSEQKDVKLNKV
jgi:hypothetical protein